MPVYTSRWVHCICTGTGSTHCLLKCRSTLVSFLRYIWVASTHYLLNCRSRGPGGVLLHICGQMWSNCRSRGPGGYIAFQVSPNLHISGWLSVQEEPILQVGLGRDRPPWPYVCMPPARYRRGRSGPRLAGFHLVHQSFGVGVLVGGIVGDIPISSCRQ